MALQFTPYQITDPARYRKREPDWGAISDSLARALQYLVMGKEYERRKGLEEEKEAREKTKFEWEYGPSISPISAMPAQPYGGVTPTGMRLEEITPPLTAPLARPRPEIPRPIAPIGGYLARKEAREAERAKAITEAYKTLATKRLREPSARSGRYAGWTPQALETRKRNLLNQMRASPLDERRDILEDIAEIDAIQKASMREYQPNAFPIPNPIPSPMEEVLPDRAIQALRNARGGPLTFANGQTWQLIDNQPVRIE